MTNHMVGLEAIIEKLIVTQAFKKFPALMDPETPHAGPSKSSPYL